MRAAAAMLPVLFALPAGSAVARPAYGGLTSPNVTYVATVPLDAGVPTGARLVGTHLYVAGSRGFSIYDVANPELPRLLSTTPVGSNFPSEDVDTNGSVLVVNDEQGPLGMVQVWDVRDKSRPVPLALLSGTREHTFTCVLDCRWLYGSRGVILDLRNPAAPRAVGRWATLPPGTDGFDVTEVSPGMVLTSSRTMRLLDARRDPAKPRLVRTGTTSDNRLIHSNRWPRNGRDRFFLVQGETPFSRQCTADSGAIMTWDARTFRMVDEFRVTNGTYADGSPAVGVAGCTAMWFQHHRTFRNGGLVAAAFFEHGVRFLDVDRRGGISEAGYFMPAAGATIAAYWITDDIVYALDLQRGIDILRYDRRAPAAAAPPHRMPTRTTLRFGAPAGSDALWCQVAVG